MNVPRARSFVPPGLEKILTRISRRIPVAVVTSKDYAFVRPRTEFACAWACVGGLEILLQDGTRYAPRTAVDIEPSFRKVERKLPAGLVLERKLASDGRLLGFTVDWRIGPKPPAREVETMARELASDGLHVIRDVSQPFLDAYATRPDKGKAVRRLKVRLGVETGVAYLGDSSFDNPAFESADVSIGVDHGQPLTRLKCEYTVETLRLASMLNSLLRANLEFTQSVARFPS